MDIRSVVRRVAAAGLWGVASTIVAAPAVPSEIEPPTIAHVDLQTGIAYMNGGVDEPEQAKLRADAHRYSLHLDLRLADGHPAMADEVVITPRGSAQVLRVERAGPMLMAALPPGHYTVQVRFGELAEQRNIEIGARARHVLWKAPRQY